MSLNRIAVLTLAAAGAAFAQLPTQKVLTLEVAQQIAQGVGKVPGGWIQGVRHGGRSR